ncbi:MAG: FkbM family methyltransferase [Cyclobacteriaceae bacterium]
MIQKIIKGLYIFSIRMINKTLLAPIRAKKNFQQVFEKLYLIGLYGMNYGRITDPVAGGEISVLKFLNEELHKKKGSQVIFDVGANVGDYISLIKQFIIKSDIVIYAFEPGVSTFNILKNKFSDVSSIYPVNCGLGNNKSKMRLFKHPVSTLSSLYEGHYGGSESYDEVDILTIDEFCLVNDIYQIDFLKIDVEGHELAVLQGANNMIKERKINYIQFEFGHNVLSRTYFSDFYKLLSEHYKIYRVVKDGLVEIQKYDAKMLEIFVASNFLAELK